MQQQLTQPKQQQPSLVTAAFNTSNMTTDQIQQYLDENKSLILKILENQNSGKLSERAENQARLQRNLMYLAAIADSQSQPLSIYAEAQDYMQHQQSHQMVAPLVITTQPSVSYAQPYPAVQQQRPVLQTQLGLTSAGTSVARRDISCNIAGDGLDGTSRLPSSASDPDIKTVGSTADHSTNWQKTER